MSFLDVLAGRQPFFADSQRVMTFCERNPGIGVASVLTFCTIAYVLRKSLGRDQMVVMLRNLRKFIAVLPMMVIYPFVQRFFVKGVMIGAVKE